MKITVKVKDDFKENINVSSDDFEDIISDLEKTGENLSKRYTKEDEISEEEAKKLAFKYTPEGQEINKYGNTVKNINNRAEGYIKAEKRHEEQIAKEKEVPKVEELDLLSDEVGKTVEASKKKNTKNTIPYRSYLILFIIITSLSACFTFSKYISYFNVDESFANVAKFDVTIDAPLGLSVNGGKGKVSFDGYLNENFGGIPYKIYKYKVTNKSDITVRIKASATGNVNHEITLLESNYVIAPNETKTVELKISPAASNLTDDNVVVKFISEQVD